MMKAPERNFSDGLAGRRLFCFGGCTASRRRSGNLPMPLCPQPSAAKSFLAYRQNWETVVLERPNRLGQVGG